MKLEVSSFRYLNKTDWRILTAIEMGLKNHELVPVELIVKISNLRRTGIKKILSQLLMNKLLHHDNKKYDSYKLTYLGYDFLALRALCLRESVVKVGRRIGVGKEADVHLAEGKNNTPIIIKLHRLGRVSFRSIKRNRDYLGNRTSASWLYMSRLSAAKEYAYLKILYENNFPVPEPIDYNRHTVVMSFVDGVLLHQIKLKNPLKVLESIMGLIVRFAECKIIHGDFNEFNLLIDSDENLTVIDFPQIITIDHPQAKEYFDRDVQCIRTYFKKHYHIEVVKYPRFEDILQPEDSGSEPMNLAISTNRKSRGSFRSQSHNEPTINDQESYCSGKPEKHVNFHPIDSLAQVTSTNDNKLFNLQSFNSIKEIDMYLQRNDCKNECDVTEDTGLNCHQNEPEYQDDQTESEYPDDQTESECQDDETESECQDDETESECQDDETESEYQDDQTESECQDDHTESEYQNEDSRLQSDKYGKIKKKKCISDSVVLSDSKDRNTKINKKKNQSDNELHFGELSNPIDITESSQDIDKKKKKSDLWIPRIPSLVNYGGRTTAANKKKTKIKKKKCDIFRNKYDIASINKQVDLYY